MITANCKAKCMMMMINREEERCPMISILFAQHIGNQARLRCATLAPCIHALTNSLSERKLCCRRISAGTISRDPTCENAQGAFPAK